MANGNDETTEDLIKGTEEAKQAAEEAVSETETEAGELQEELDRRAADESASGAG